MRFYHQNSRKIWLVILTFVTIIVLIQIVNSHATETLRIREEEAQRTPQTQEPTNNFAVISQVPVPEDVQIRATNIIDEFVNHGNNGRIEEAYALLSDEIKEVLFPTIESFRANYFERTFSEFRRHTTQAWINNAGLHTYVVELKEDMLATGRTSNMNLRDYFTITAEGRLNISGFVTREQLDIERHTNNVSFTITSKDVFMDFVRYNITVQNNSLHTIMLDSRENTRAIYITDANGVNHIAHTHEILEEDLILRRAHRRNIQIRFTKRYRPHIPTTSMTFSDIILNHEEYVTHSNRREYENRTSATIEFSR